MIGNGVLELVRKRQEKIREVEKYGTQIGGYHQYIGFLSGKKTTLRNAVKAECYCCQGLFADGKAPCISPLCPLYAWAPFTHEKKSGTVRPGQFQKKTDGAPTDKAGV